MPNGFEARISPFENRFDIFFFVCGGKFGNGQINVVGGIGRCSKMRPNYASIGLVGYRPDQCHAALEETRICEHFEDSALRKAGRSNSRLLKKRDGTSHGLGLLSG